jgi:hypothetical protein
VVWKIRSTAVIRVDIVSCIAIDNRWNTVAKSQKGTYQNDRQVQPKCPSSIRKVKSWNKEKE